MQPPQPIAVASRTSSSPTSGALPRRFGRYVLHQELARGGMATVYLAQHDPARGVRKWVAIKLVHPHTATEPHVATMFLDEARLATRLSHPNICQVFDFGEVEGCWFLAMELLDGEPLNALIRAALGADRLAAELGARVVFDAARGLHAAHELREADGSSAEVVHRDVSPQNLIVLYDGVTKVVDFGIARSKDQLSERTAIGELKGKIAYMSPEQVNQERVDRRSDVFSLGVVLWEATLGRRLFRRETDVQTLRAVLDAPIPRPSAYEPGYPPALERIVMRALARRPADRYATADQMARELEAYLADVGDAGSVSRLADTMRELFGAAIVEKREMRRAAEAAAAWFAAGDEGSVSSRTGPGGGGGARGTPMAVEVEAGERTTRLSAPRGRGRLALVASLGVAATVLAAAGVLSATWSGGQRAATAQTARAPAEAPRAEGQRAEGQRAGAGAVALAGPAAATPPQPSALSGHGASGQGASAQGEEASAPEPAAVEHPARRAARRSAGRRRAHARPVSSAAPPRGPLIQSFDGAH